MMNEVEEKSSGSERRRQRLRVLELEARDLANRMTWLRIRADAIRDEGEENENNEVLADIALSEFALTSERMMVDGIEKEGKDDSDVFDYVPRSPHLGPMSSKESEGILADPDPSGGENVEYSPTEVGSDWSEVLSNAGEDEKEEKVEKEKEFTGVSKKKGRKPKAIPFSENEIENLMEMIWLSPGKVIIHSFSCTHYERSMLVGNVIEMTIAEALENGFRMAKSHGGCCRRAFCPKK